MPIVPPSQVHHDTEFGCYFSLHVCLCRRS